MGKTITFAELDTLSAAFGAWLQANGCMKGTRVALMMPNILQYPMCLFGVLRAGCTVVNVNPLYTARELEHQLKDSGAEVIVVVENFAHTVQEVLANDAGEAGDRHQHRRAAGLQGHRRRFRAAQREEDGAGVDRSRGAMRLSDALSEGRKHKLERVPLGHDDIAFLQYTGGTTGVAKGAMLLHRNIVANLLQARAWIKPFLDPNAARSHHHAAAALSHLLADGELPDVHDARRRERADHQSARHSRASSRRWRSTGSPRSPASTRCSTRCVNNAEFGKLDFSTLRAHARRRHGGAEGGGREMEAGHRQAADRGLRPDRDLAGGDDQSARPAELQRLDRPADPVDRSHAARRRRQGGARSASRARSASAARR